MTGQERPDTASAATDIIPDAAPVVLPPVVPAGVIVAHLPDGRPVYVSASDIPPDTPRTSEPSRGLDMHLLSWAVFAGVVATPVIGITAVVLLLAPPVITAVGHAVLESGLGVGVALGMVALVLGMLAKARKR